LEDFEALCRQAQITFIVPIVPRPRPPGPAAGTSSTTDVKDKSAPKATKGAANKDREAASVLQQQHSEVDTGESSRGLFIKTNSFSKQIVFF
jgi:hypothetical protein